MEKLPPKNILDDFVEMLVDIYLEEHNTIWKIHQVRPEEEAQDEFRPYMFLTGTIDQVANYLTTVPEFWRETPSNDETKPSQWERGNVSILETFALSDQIIAVRKELLSDCKKAAENKITLNDTFNRLPKGQFVL